MLDIQLAIDHILKRYTGISQRPSVFWGDAQPGLIHIDQRVVHTSERHIDLNSTENFSLNKQVQVLDKCRHHVQRYAQAATVSALGSCGDQTSWGV
ncbi:hypothetical protein D3C75_1114310 [compost metagenome]